MRVCRETKVFVNTHLKYLWIPNLHVLNAILHVFV